MKATQSNQSKLKNETKKRSLFRFSPRMRHGTGALLLVFVIIAIAVVIIYAADKTESALALDSDLSFNGATVQGAITESVLKSLDSDVQIWLIVSGTSDYDTYYAQSDTIEGLLKRYSAITPYIHYQRTTLVANPTLATRFTDSVGENAVSEDCVLIYSKATGRARVLQSEDYYTISLDESYDYTYLVQYEKVLTEAICSVTGDELPKLQVLTGHGELSLEDISTMTNALKNANWDVRSVSLRSDTLDPTCLLFILSPQYDLSDDELRLLDEFASLGGDFFIAMEYTDPVDLPNFYTLLSIYGVSPYTGIVLADESAPAYSYYQERYYLMPYLMNTSATSGLLSANENILLVPGARAFETLVVPDNSVNVESVLRTDIAYIRDISDGIDSIEKQAGELNGTFDIAVLSTRITSSGDRSKAFIIGNTTMFTSEWVQKQTSSVPLLLNMVKYLQGASSIDLDIPSVPLSRNGIRLQNLTIPYILIALLPLLILAIAMIILIPRKHR